MCFCLFCYSVFLVAALLKSCMRYDTFREVGLSTRSDCLDFVVDLNLDCAGMVNASVIVGHYFQCPYACLNYSLNIYFI